MEKLFFSYFFCHIILTHSLHEEKYTYLYTSHCPFTHIEGEAWSEVEWSKLKGKADFDFSLFLFPPSFSIQAP